MNRYKAILAGGSGYLGALLAQKLVQLGWDVVILTREPDRYHGNGRAIHWNGRTIGPWVAEMEHATVLVNLTGKRVDCRPTKANREAIITSRVESVRVLGEVIRQVDHPPITWIQCSSTAAYGDAGDRVCTEAAHVPEGYPMDVCVAWEAALGQALLPGMRHVILRISFVLGARAGALPILARLARWGLGGPIGNGCQWISWIHEDDMVNLFIHAINDSDWHGVINATGPSPMTSRAFMKTLRKRLKRPWSPAVPKHFVYLGAWLINSDPNIALTGRRAVPTKLEALKFPYEYPTLKTALQNLNL